LFIAFGAWASGLLCAFVAARHVKRQERFACPGAEAIVERARKGAEDAPPATRSALARLELDLIRDEAMRMLALATLLPRGMARIALATGTALAVVALTRYAKEGIGPATIGAFASFSGGAFGSALAAWSGRRARELASTARHEWKRALMAAGRTLDEET
jgi:hypothetical protein